MDIVINSKPPHSVTITRTTSEDPLCIGVGDTFRGTTRLIQSAKRQLILHVHPLHPANLVFSTRISKLPYDERTEVFPESAFHPNTPILLIRHGNSKNVIAYYPENPKTAHLEYNRGKILILPGVQLSGIRNHQTS